MLKKKELKCECSKKVYKTVIAAKFVYKARKQEYVIFGQRVQCTHNGGPDEQTLIQTDVS